MNLTLHSSGLSLDLDPDEIADFCHMVDGHTTIDFARELQQRLKQEGLM
jgi:hypothetical protein